MRKKWKREREIKDMKKKGIDLYWKPAGWFSYCHCLSLFPVFFSCRNFIVSSSQSHFHDFQEQEEKKACLPHSLSRIVMPLETIHPHAHPNNIVMAIIILCRPKQNKREALLEDQLVMAIPFTLSPDSLSSPFFSSDSSPTVGLQEKEIRERLERQVKDRPTSQAFLSLDDDNMWIYNRIKTDSAQGKVLSKIK